MKQIRYILSSLIILFLTGCYPGEDFGIDVTMLINDFKVGYRSVNVTTSYQILDGDPNITEVGVCWEELYDEKQPTVQRNSKEAKSVTSPYSVLLTDLRESTEYIIRPYIKVDGFIVYGNVGNFTTPSNSSFLPYLGELLLNKSELHKLVVSSSITSVPSEYPVAEVGVCYIKGNLTNFTKGMSGVKSIKSDLNDNKFTVEITDLDFSSSYSVRAYAINEVGIRYGDVKTFRTVGDEYVPKLGEVTITKNAPTYLEVSCTVSEPLKTDSINAWFEYTGSYTSTQKVETKVKEGKIVARIDNLQPSYDYSIVAKAENIYGVGSSNTKYVTTDNGVKYKPTVNAPTLSDITVYGAHVESVIKIINNDYKALSGGFEYSTSSYMNSPITKTGVLVNDTILKLDLSELSENKTYYIQAYIDTQLGKVYSNRVNFKTRVWGPIFDNILVTDTTMTSLNLSCNYKLPDQKHKITEAGFQYYKSDYSYYVEYGSLYAGIVDEKKITLSLSDLKENSTYQVRTYMKLDDGKTYYGETIAIKTKQASDYFDEIVVSDLTPTSFNLSSEHKFPSEKYKVIEAGFQCDGSAYSVNYGELYAGELKGGKITLSLSNLKEGTTYKIRAYVKLDNGTIYYGNTINVKTKDKEDFIPIISDVEVSDIMLKSAKVKATIDIKDDRFPILKAGFVFVKSGYWTYVEGQLEGNLLTAVLDGLQPGTTYKQLSAYADTSLGRNNGEETSFTTLSSSALPSVECNDITSVNTSSLSIEASVKENHKSYPITEAGFVYIKSTSTSALTLNTNNAIRKPLSIQDGKIKMTVDGLDNNSTYLVRAYAISGDEVSYNEKTIRVYTNMDNYKPSMGTLSVEKTNGEYIASCKATVSQVFPITDSGFVYSTSTSSPTLESNDGVVSAQISESLISNKIPFKKPQTGTTTYYVRAYAKNANGVTYSSYRAVNVSWND